MRDLVLTGFMGTGKSTLARQVAHRYGLRCVDLDREIERRAGKSVATIFREDGEPRFRCMERELLAEMAELGGGRVIATGGGALVSDANANLLRPDQMVVTLTCDAETALHRARPETRPLLHGASRADMLELWESRQSAYGRYPAVDTSEGADALAALDSLVGLTVAGSYAIDERRTSDIVVERGVTQRLPERLAAKQVLIVSDETVRGLDSVDRAISALGDVAEVTEAIIPPGEDRKHLGTLGSLYQTCLAAHLDRSAVVVGIGGGVICDMAGLLAATYLRGIRLVLVPTTLLAQVDAAIGGKTGIDLDGVKNMIGAFYPAEAVLVDPDILRSLLEATLADGLAEIVKIATVRNPDLLVWVEQLARARNVIDQPAIVRQAAVEKVQVVAEDPLERGVRALLNFGHTVGHAIETAANFRLSHGTCVAVGMVAEAHLAESRGWCEPGIETRLRAALKRLGLPCHASEVDAEVALRSVLQDKKRVDGRLRFAVPDRLGHGVVVTVSEDDARYALAYATEGAI